MKIHMELTEKEQKELSSVSINMIKTIAKVMGEKFDLTFDINSDLTIDIEVGITSIVEAIYLYTAFYESIGCLLPRFQKLSQVIAEENWKIDITSLVKVKEVTVDNHTTVTQNVHEIFSASSDD